MSDIVTIPAEEQKRSEYAIKQALFDYLIEALQTDVEHPFEELVTEFVETNMAELSAVSGEQDILSQKYFDLFATWFNNFDWRTFYDSKGLKDPIKRF